MTLSKTGSCPSRTNTLVALGVLIASLSALGPARAQPPPAGVEFQVDSATTATAQFPAVATAADGSFVVVWETVARRASSVWGQRFDADGQRVGGKFLVSDSGRTDGAPAVGMDEAGNFLVAWRGWLRRQDVQVLGRFYDSSGTPSGPPFRINASGGVLSGRPISVTMNHVAEAVVAWERFPGGVTNQRFDRFGNFVGDEFLVSETLHGSSPSASIAADGSFVVTASFSTSWYGYTSDVFAQRFDGSGARSGGLLNVSSPPNGTGPAAGQFNGYPAAAIGPDGAFVVTWQGSTYPAAAVLARLYNAAGTASVGLTVASSAGPVGGNALWPVVAMGADGAFLVAWTVGRVVRGQWYDSYGIPLGDELQIAARSGQGRPSVAIAANGTVVAVWERPARRRSPGGIYGQRFAY